MKILIFGSPGSGKGTQAVLISNHLNLRHISLGDILREEVKKNSPLGEEVKSYMEKGLLVPDDLVSRVIEVNVDNQEFILDGYPRNLNQAKKLEEIITRNDNKIDVVIYLDTDKETIVDRLSKRRICKNCGATYHLENLPPRADGICDLCGRELIQRKDDNSEVIMKRWEVFNKESNQILDFYKEKAKIIKVDSRGKIEEVFEKIKENLS